MVNPKQGVDVQFLSRQVGFLAQDHGLSLDESLKKMAELKGSKSISVIEVVADRARRGRGDGLSTLSQVFHLIDIGDVKDEQAVELLKHYCQLQNETDQMVESYFNSLRVSFAYCLALLAVAFFVCALFSFRIGPGFLETFGSFGAELSVTTAFMFNGGGMLYSAILLLLFFFVLFCWLTSKKSYNKFQQFHCSALSDFGVFASVPAITAINDYTMLKYLYLFLQANKSVDEAEALANKAAGLGQGEPINIKNEKIKSYLEFSKENETYAQELNFQLGCASIELSRALSKFRAVFNVGAQMVGLLVIGTLLMSCYLPIFKLGQFF